MSLFTNFLPKKSINYKKSLNDIIKGFLVAGTGLEPVTFGL